MSYGRIAEFFGIAKSTVTYIKKQEKMKNKQTKSRLFDGTLQDFDAGVVSVLGSPERHVSRKVVKAAAIFFSERIGCKKFKASDGWVEKFLHRKFPEYKKATRSSKRRQNVALTMMTTDDGSNPLPLQQPPAVVANMFDGYHLAATMVM